jgi:hypothetical protein
MAQYRDAKGRFASVHKGRSAKAQQRLNKLMLYSFAQKMQNNVEDKIKKLAEEAIAAGKEYYLSRRKKKYFDLIVKSMVYDTKFSPGVGVELNITMGGPKAPYAIFVDRGFAAPYDAGGPKVFDGYDFSGFTREYLLERVEKEVGDAAVKAVVESLEVITPWRKHYKI